LWISQNLEFKFALDCFRLVTILAYAPTQSHEKQNGVSVLRLFISQICWKMKQIALLLKKLADPVAYFQSNLYFSRLLKRAFGQIEALPTVFSSGPRPISSFIHHSGFFSGKMLGARKMSD